MTAGIHLDPPDGPDRDLRLLLSALVVPRPIAWVSTLGPTGVANLAPHSYFNVVSHDPAHVAFSATAVRDTLTNLRVTGEFVVNLVNRDLAEAMNLTAADFPPEEDEFRWAGVTAVPSVRVAAPRVAEARAHLECRVTAELPVGSATLVIGRVVHLRVDGDVLRHGRVDPRLLDPVCRLAGNTYAVLGDVFTMPRPVWPDIAGTGR